MCIHTHDTGELSRSLLPYSCTTVSSCTVGYYQVLLTNVCVMEKIWLLDNYNQTHSS